jgi:hypothetical protein
VSTGDGDDSDVRAIGTVSDIYGNDLTVAVWHGRVNVAGRMLDLGAAEEFGRLFLVAMREARKSGNSEGESRG